MHACAPAAHAGKVCRSLEAAEQKYNTVCLEERAKFEEETNVNVDGLKKKAHMAKVTLGLECGVKVFYFW